MSALLIGIGGALASWLLTWLAIQYARAAQMQDDPGARRMHAQPTARGAGLGFVAVIVAGWGGWGMALGWSSPHGRWALGASVGLLLVAVVSWIDDRRGLPVLPRLITHVAAAVVLLIAAWPTLAAELPVALALFLPLLAVPAINFWNFVDGINGIAASQAVVVAAALATLALIAGDTPAAWFAALAAGAVLGFLPSNFPKARAFMGDVGSASLGFIIIALATQPVPSAPAWPIATLLLAAPVFLDTGLTLAWRMLRRPRRRWYTAHREHLYQWLARAGWGHTRTTLSYLACAAGIASIVLFIGPLQTEPMLIAAFVVYLSGAMAWRLGRDRVLARMRGSA